MVDEHDQPADADEQQGECQGDPDMRDERDTVVRFGAHCAQHEERVREGADEDAEHRLIHPIGDEAAKEARGELAARQLQRDDGHGKDRPRDRDEASRDGSEHAACPFGTASEDPEAGCCVVECGRRNPYRDEGERAAEHHRQAGDEPEAVADPDPCETKT